MAVSSGTMTVTTTPAIVDGSSPNPFTLIVHNESATNTVTLGNSNLTASNGFSLHANSTIQLPLGAGDHIYAVASSGSHDISWIKIY